MTRKELFLKSVLECDIDEVWVNFQNPFEGVHSSSNERFLVYKKDAFLGDADLGDASLLLPVAFGGDLESTDFTTDLATHVIYGKDSRAMQCFDQYKRDCYLLYRKGDGIIG